MPSDRSKGRRPTRYAMHVILEGILQLLLVIGGLIGMVVVLSASTLAALGLQAGNIRATAIGVTVGWLQIMFLFVLAAILKAQRQVIQRLRTPPTATAPSA